MLLPKLIGAGAPSEDPGVAFLEVFEGGAPGRRTRRVGPFLPKLRRLVDVPVA